MAGGGGGSGSIGTMAGTAVTAAGGGARKTAAKAGHSPSAATKMMKTIGSMAEHASHEFAKKVGLQLHPLKPTSVELTVLH